MHCQGQGLRVGCVWGGDPVLFDCKTFPLILEEKLRHGEVPELGIRNPGVLNIVCTLRLVPFPRDQQAHATVQNREP